MYKPFFRLMAAFFLLAVLTASPAQAAGQTVDQLLAAMSPEEKIGQMMVVFFQGPDMSADLERVIAETHVGGVILYSSAGNIESPSQVAKLTADLQRRAGETPRGIGLIVSVDQEGGPISRLRDGVTLFPSQMAIAATGDRENARAAARITAQELKALGINSNFAPVADVNSNPQNPIIGIRSFGSDPDEVSRLTAAMTAEYVRAGVICTPKHFPGHGDTDVDSHQGLPLSNHDARTLDRVDFPPFRAAFASGAPAVMTAHVEVPALDPTPSLPATLSSKVLEGVLRGKMHFQGLIVTDSLGMGALDKTVGTAEAAVRAAKAGADVLLFGADKGHTPGEQPAVFQRLLGALRSGELPAKRVDEAVRRILEAKQTYGLLQAKAIPGAGPEIAYLVGTPENLRAARSIAEASLTLYRDPEKLLPVKPGQGLLIVRCRKMEPGQADPLAMPGASLQYVGLEPTEAQAKQAAEAAAQSGLVVVLTYDAVNHPAQRSLLRTLLSVKPRKLVHVASGSPYDLTLFPGSQACVATYGDVPVSMEALAKGLTGQISLSGRLPVKLP